MDFRQYIMNHWHCGHFGTQKNILNLSWDFSDWAFPFHISWDGLMFSVHFLAFILIYWKKECRGIITGKIKLDPEPMHTWFELSYAQFLTVPRIVMQSMPLLWQDDMVRLLEEMDNTFDWRPEKGRYHVQLKDFNGRFLSLDPNICDYRHGNVELLRKKGGS